MYKSKIVKRCQDAWILVMFALLSAFIHASNWSLWISIPIGLLGFITLSWTGISIICLFDYNHRMALKYNVRIENVPYYTSLFDEMVEKEMIGIDTSGIPEGIKDPEEWLRFCQWQFMEGLNN